ncbi:hypothetical protein JCM33374_g265 [Metschnikowia sp. JCM 33374]|nr:hypothetical protein JCM33374_g265 [Metschnikowia sp. JCM 33374]
MPQITPIRGFTNTPVTKAICAASTIVALSLSILVSKQYVSLAIDPFVVKYSQYWRVATFQLAVVNESDYIVTIALWFHFKTLERLFGPRKYFSLVTLFALYNAVGTFLVLCIGQLSLVYLAAIARFLIWRQPMQTVYYDTIFNAVVPGPFGILASLYICHGTYIPTSYHFKILLQKPEEGSPETPGSTERTTSSGTANLGKYITLTNHFQVHFLFTILMLNHGFSSLIPCLVGVFIGHLYTKDLLAGSRSWLLPPLLFQLFVAPQKLRSYTARTLSRRWQGYQRVSSVDTEPSPPIIDESTGRLEEEDAEVAIDDIRQQSDNPVARSTSPVRPLGRQFLDTFRT